MQQVTLEEIREIASNSKDELYENANYAGLNCPKIILHWTAGWWDQLFDEYHVSITGDGEIYVSTYNFADVLSHTWKLNTGTIGISLCCAVGATTNDLGENPPTEIQIDVLAQVIATICKELQIDINIDNVMTHGEAGDNENLYDEDDLYGPNNDCERWDLQLLGTDESPVYTPDHDDPSTGGNVIREKARNYLNSL